MQIKKQLLGIYGLFCFDAYLTLPYLRQKKRQRENGTNEPLQHAPDSLSTNAIKDPDLEWFFMPDYNSKEKKLTEGCSPQYPYFVPIDFSAAYSITEVYDADWTEEQICNFAKRKAETYLPDVGIGGGRLSFAEYEEQENNGANNKDLFLHLVPSFIADDINWAEPLENCDAWQEDQADLFMGDLHDVCTRASREMFRYKRTAGHIHYRISEALTHRPSGSPNNIIYTLPILDTSTSPNKKGFHYIDMLMQSAMHRLRLERCNQLCEDTSEVKHARVFVSQDEYGDRIGAITSGLLFADSWNAIQKNYILDASGKSVYEKNINLGKILNKAYLATDAHVWDWVLPQSPTGDDWLYNIVPDSPSPHREMLSMRHFVGGALTSRYLPCVESQAFEVFGHVNTSIVFAMQALKETTVDWLNNWMRLDIPRGIDSVDVTVNIRGNDGIELLTQDRAYFVRDDMFLAQPPHLVFDYNWNAQSWLGILSNVFNRPLFLFTSNPPTVEDCLSGNVDLDQNGLFSPIPLTQIVLVPPQELERLGNLAKERFSALKNERTSFFGSHIPPPRNMDVGWFDEKTTAAASALLWNHAREADNTMMQFIYDMCKKILYSESGYGQHKTSHVNHDYVFSILYGDNWKKDLIAERDTWLEQLRVVLGLSPDYPSHPTQRNPRRGTKKRR